MRLDMMHLLRRPAPSFDDHRDWMDVTTIDDCWEVQLDPRGDMSKDSSYQHRSLSMMPGGRTTDWIPGRPPTGTWAGPRKWLPRFYPHHAQLDDPEDGAIVIYGPKDSGAGCSEPSFSIWMVPGTGHEPDQSA